MSREIYLDDESIPLWVRIKECMRMCDLALSECKSRGQHMVEAEVEYYTAKAEESFRLLEAGYANTLIQTVIKGRPRVAEAMGEYHAAQVEYENAREARNIWKKKLDTLREQYTREWSEAREV